MAWVVLEKNRKSWTRRGSIGSNVLPTNFYKGLWYLVIVSMMIDWTFLTTCGWREWLQT